MSCFDARQLIEVVVRLVLSVIEIKKLVEVSSEFGPRRISPSTIEKPGIAGLFNAAVWGHGTAADCEYNKVIS